MKFFFRNKLHQHLRNCTIKSTKKVFIEAKDEIIISITYYDSLKIIYLKAPSNEAQNLEFRSWHYVIIKTSIVVVQDNDIVLEEKNSVNFNIISNFKCIMLIIDYEFLLAQFFDAIIKHTS